MSGKAGGSQNVAVPAHILFELFTVAPPGPQTLGQTAKLGQSVCSIEKSCRYKMSSVSEKSRAAERCRLVERSTQELVYRICTEADRWKHLAVNPQKRLPLC
jgi:hypothetical protein